MDPISGLKGDLFRPLVTLFIPGVMAASPFGVLAYKALPLFAKILHSPGGVLLVFLAGLLVGMILEEIGSQIESLIWKVMYQNEYPNEEWNEYLQLQTGDQIIGQRYLRTIHIRLKFELAMIPGLVSFAIGENIYNHFFGTVPLCYMVLLTLITVFLAIYLCYEASRSIKILADVRRNIVAACRHYEKIESSK